MSQLRADLWFVFLSALWGSSFLVISDTLAGVDPFLLVAIRFILAAGLLALAFRRHLNQIEPEELYGGAVLGVSLALGFILQTIGIGGTTPTKAAFVTGLGSVLIPILSALWLKERPGLGAIIGVAVATVGLGFLTLREGFTYAPGDAWVLACTLPFAVYVVAVSYFTTRCHPLRLIVVQLAAAAVTSSIGVTAFGEWEFDFQREHGLAIAFLAMFPTALAFGIQPLIQRYTTPTHVAVILITEPMFAALFSWWFAGDLLTRRELLGCVLIVIGMILSEVRLWNKERDAHNNPVPSNIQRCSIPGCPPPRTQARDLKTK